MLIKFDLTAHIKKFCASSDHHYKRANVINMVQVGVTDAFALGIPYIVLYYDPKISVLNS